MKSLGKLLAALGIGASYRVARIARPARGGERPKRRNGYSGAITFGIGEATAAISQLATRITVQALAHGSFQGAVSGIQGGNFWQGFASGAAASIASSLWSGGNMAKGGKWGGLGGRFAKSGAGMITFGTISGGAGAALSGGNFWEGAATGFVVSAANHVLHKSQTDPLKKYKDEAISLKEWTKIYENKSWKEIATEMGWKHGQPKGPKYRYVINPVDENVMDMRHVVVVGYGYGEKIGNIVEHLQNLVPSMRPSAYDPQDYYSNKIGAYFYQLRHSGSWASNSWSYDFKRFVDVHYRSLSPLIIPKK